MGSVQIGGLHRTIKQEFKNVNIKMNINFLNVIIVSKHYWECLGRGIKGIRMEEQLLRILRKAAQMRE